MTEKCILFRWCIVLSHCLFTGKGYGGALSGYGGHNSGYGISYTGGKGYRSSEAEDVGSSYSGSYSSHQAPVIPGPAYSISYPSPAPQVKCGSNLLISCTPTSQVVPCSSYSPPSYSSTY